MPGATRRVRSLPARSRRPRVAALSLPLYERKEFYVFHQGSIYSNVIKV